MVTVGFTTLQEGTVEAFAAALPDPRSVEQLKRVAGQCAAGIAAEFENGASVNGPDSLAHRDDLQQLVQIAGTLGIGTSTDDVAVRVFIDSAVQLAQTALNGDDGVAWDRVTTALLRKKYLSGGEVRAIVAECPVTSSTCIGPKRN